MNAMTFLLLRKHTTRQVCPRSRRISASCAHFCLCRLVRFALRWPTSLSGCTPASSPRIFSPRATLPACPPSSGLSLDFMLDLWSSSSPLSCELLYRDAHRILESLHSDLFCKDHLALPPASQVGRGLCASHFDPTPKSAFYAGCFSGWRSGHRAAAGLYVRGRVLALAERRRRLGFGAGERGCFLHSQESDHLTLVWRVLLCTAERGGR